MPVFKSADWGFNIGDRIQIANSTDVGSEFRGCFATVKEFRENLITHEPTVIFDVEMNGYIGEAQCGYRYKHMLSIAQSVPDVEESDLLEVLSM